MMRALTCGVLLGSIALAGCGDDTGGGGGSGGGSGGGDASTTTATTTATTATTAGSGGAGGGLADECPELNATEPCDGGGMRGCGEATDGSGRLVWSECDMTSGAASTPLVLSFDGADAAFATDATTAFDLTGLGQSMATDWPTARTPWLALDRDGDGSIGDGRELFGSAVEIDGGRLAKHGFEALAALDANADGVIDARDPRFADLRLWADRNGDRRSEGELSSLASARVESISLAYTRAARCDDRGNCGIERASFTWIDGFGARHEGTVIDVYLPTRAN